MSALLQSLPVLDGDIQAGLLLVALLLMALLAVRLASRPKPVLRLLVQDRASRGLTVPAIAREFSLSQDAVRLLLVSAPARRKIEPSGRNYRTDRQSVPQGSRRVTVGSRCDVSA
jgi:hypothetical protein